MSRQARQDFIVQQPGDSAATRSGEIVITKSLDGRITSWTKDAEALFGFTAAQAIGKHISIIIPFDYQDEEYEILDRIKHGETVPDRKTVRRCHEGRMLDVIMSVSPVRNAKGKVIEIRNVYRLVG